MAKGSVSTHVLDTTTGRPAAGVRIELQRDGAAIAHGVTDADGRVRELACDLDAGHYRLVFDTRTYARDVFFSRIAIDVTIGEGHTHVPLLLSRYSITVYRGS